MATWLAHLRVAELISAELRAPWLSEPDFLAGNVAPEFSTDFHFLTPQAMQEWVERSALDIAAQVSSLRLSI